MQVWCYVCDEDLSDIASTLSPENGEAVINLLEAAQGHLQLFLGLIKESDLKEEYKLGKPATSSQNSYKPIS